MTGIDWDAYTRRAPDLKGQTAQLLRTMVGREILPTIKSVLEVGCNVGHNLEAWEEASKVVGVEPNDYARKTAQQEGWDVIAAEAHQLPFLDNSFDLVFTAGVLIHIQPEHFGASLGEIHRVARKFILAVEYQADKPTPVEYRGVPDGIWKRNYGREYTTRHPNLTVSGMGWPYQLKNTPFEGCTWWLFTKTR